MNLAQIKPWVWAARPKTLPAAAIPVVIGGAAAYSSGGFAGWQWSLCLGFALAIQVGTNYANDYYDYLKGADTKERRGPARAVASGWVSPQAMKTATTAVFISAFVIGLGLLPHGGVWLLPLGLLCIFCGYAYTGGPYPLGYNGWGDVFVFVFFGWVATGVTYYVQTGNFSPQIGAAAGGYLIWLCGSLPGALATNLLAVNNHRDAGTDAGAGKRTLAVRFGTSFVFAEYVAMNLVALAVPVVIFSYGGPWQLLLTLLVAPLMILATVKLHKCEHGAALGMTAGCLLLAGILFGVGLTAGL